MSVTEIAIHGLSKADALELAEFVPPEELQIEEQPTPEGSFGELALATAIIFASAAALKAYVAYLAHKERGDEIDQELEVVHQDGRRERTRLRVRRRSTDPISADAARELSSITGFPAEVLLPQPS
jgi:hypothetical protein